MQNETILTCFGQKPAQMLSIKLFAFVFVGYVKYLLLKNASIEKIKEVNKDRKINCQMSDSSLWLTGDIIFHSSWCQHKGKGPFNSAHTTCSLRYGRSRLHDSVLTKAKKWKKIDKCLGETHSSLLSQTGLTRQQPIRSAKGKGWAGAQNDWYSYFPSDKVGHGLYNELWHFN